MAAAAERVRVLPVKRIHSMEDLTMWRSSESFRSLMSFVRSLNESVVGVPSVSARVSDDSQLPVSVPRLLGMLGRISSFIDEIPPIAGENAGRFGNKSFRAWHARLVQETPGLLEPVLAGQDDVPGLVLELGAYLHDSFGNPTRIDYGTGHELHFVAFLYCLAVLGVFVGTGGEEDASARARANAAVVLRVFREYLVVCRKLQAVYKQEPAGSHGVWGLDDHQFMPFIFGSAQMVGRDDEFSPEDVLNRDKVSKFSDQSLYVECVDHIYKVKRGPFCEHSPDLYNISSAASWRKINNGMQKKYDVEVLCKFPVTQHFLFGTLLPWPSVQK